MIFKFVSLEDDRLTEECIDGLMALKLYYYHEHLFGKNKAYIEQGGVEIDPDELQVEDIDR